MGFIPTLKGGGFPVVRSYKIELEDVGKHSGTSDNAIRHTTRYTMAWLNQSTSFACVWNDCRVESTPKYFEIFIWYSKC